MVHQDLKVSRSQGLKHPLPYPTYTVDDADLNTEYLHSLSFPNQSAPFPPNPTKSQHQNITSQHQYYTDCEVDPESQTDLASNKPQLRLERGFPIPSPPHPSQS